MNAEKAGPDDIDALVELRLDYLTEDNGGLDERVRAAVRRDLPAYFRRHLGRDLSVFVIRDGRRIVSCAFLLAVEKPMSPAFPNGKTGLVLNVYTRPSHRRKGCAGRVMRALIEEAEKAEITVLELKATESGRALYRSVGFSDDLGKYSPMKWRKQ